MKGYCEKLGLEKKKLKNKKENIFAKKNILDSPKNIFGRSRIIHPSCENKKFFLRGELFGKFSYYVFRQTLRNKHLKQILERLKQRFFFHFKIFPNTGRKKFVFEKQNKYKKIFAENFLSLTNFGIKKWEQYFRKRWGNWFENKQNYYLLDSSSAPHITEFLPLCFSMKLYCGSFIFVVVVLPFFVWWMFIDWTLILDASTTTFCRTILA